MPRFAANLSMLFKEYPFLERFAAAREAGFEGVEVLFPYDDPAPAIREMIADNRLTLALINAPPPNYTERPRGFAAVPGGEQVFETDLKRAVRVAEVLKPERIHMMAGVAEGPEARDTFVRNLRVALETGLTFTIEPLNSDDVPGYFLNDYTLAAGIIEEIGHPRLGLQYDLYHIRKMGLDPLAVFDAHKDIISHIQISGGLERCAPSPDEAEFRRFLEAVESAGYDGWLSGEYKPIGPTEDSLLWSR